MRPLALATCPVCHQGYAPPDDPTTPTIPGRCPRCVPAPIQAGWSAEQLLTAVLRTIPQLATYLRHPPSLPQRFHSRSARAATKEIFQAAAQVTRNPNPYADLIATKLGFADATALCAYPDAPLLLWDAFWGPDGRRHHRLACFQEPWRLFWGQDLILHEPYHPTSQAAYPHRPSTLAYANARDITRYHALCLRQTQWMTRAYRSPRPTIAETFPEP